MDGAALLRELDRDGCVTVSVDGEALELRGEEIAVDLEAREGFEAASGGVGVVVLRTELTPELLEEALARRTPSRPDRPTHSH